MAALAALAHGDSAAAAALFLVFKLADLASLSLAEGEQARERESLRSRLIRNVESKAILARTLDGADSVPRFGLQNIESNKGDGQSTEERAGV